MSRLFNPCRRTRQLLGAGRGPARPVGEKAADPARARDPGSAAVAAPHPGDPPNWSRRALLALGALLFLVLATFAVWGFALGGLAAPLPGFELSADAIVALIRSWGAWGVAGSLMLMVLHSFVPFPAEIIAIANGMLYGPVWGTVITWTGAMLGAWMAFALARWLGRPFVRSVIAERHHEALDRWALRQGGGALLLSRLVPVISFNLINYAAGLTAISWWTFTWATGLGILPLTFAMVVMGDRLWSGAAGLWLWLLLAAVLACSIWWAMGLRRRSQRRPAR